jgi:hypothetical protein
MRMFAFPKFDSGNSLAWTETEKASLHGRLKTVLSLGTFNLDKFKSLPRVMACMKLCAFVFLTVHHTYVADIFLLLPLCPAELSRSFLLALFAAKPRKQ